MANSLSELYQVVTRPSRSLQRVFVLVTILLCCAPTLAQEELTSRDLELANPGVTNPVDLLKPGGRLVGEAGTSSRIRILQGGETEARAFFEQLTQGGRVLENSRFPGTLVELPGGGKIGFRPVSKSGPATVDVFIEGVGIRETEAWDSRDGWRQVQGAGAVEVPPPGDVGSAIPGAPWPHG